VIFRKQALAPDEYDRLPQFTYQDEALMSVLDRSLLPGLYLLLASLGIGCYGLWAYRRFPVAG
jgi:hypothetical protein